MKQIQSLSHQDLIDYCHKHEIVVPVTAPREAVEAAIFAATRHGQQETPDVEIGCFGYNDRTDANCIMCRYREECETATLGMPRKRYDANVKRLTNPIKNFVPFRRKNK